MTESSIKNDSVLRSANGRWYTKFNGELSAVHKATREQAEEHLRKLQAGLVKFSKLSDMQVTRSCKMGVAMTAAYSNATNLSRATREMAAKY